MLRMKKRKKKRTLPDQDIVVMGITSLYQNTQFQKLFLFIDTRFNKLVMDSFLDFKPKGGAISINNFETCDVTCFFALSICLKVFENARWLGFFMQMLIDSCCIVSVGLTNIAGTTASTLKFINNSSS